MKISDIKYILISFLSITLFYKIENLALNLGSSWTFAKILPYSLTIICGFLLAIQIKKLNIKNTLIKYLSIFLIFIMPFTISFALHPIYEGDFTNSPLEKVKINYSLNDFKSDGLTVTTIPDCPFCFGSIGMLKKIQKRNPKLKIDFVVCAKNKKYLTKYKNEIKGAFNIRLANNADSLARTADLRFPTFFLVKNKKPVYKWSNDQFNVFAIDHLESKF